eukprot:856191-Pyramimonas_sp.AAC.1
MPPGPLRTPSGPPPEPLKAASRCVPRRPPRYLRTGRLGGRLVADRLADRLVPRTGNALRGARGGAP